MHGADRSSGFAFARYDLEVSAPVADRPHAHDLSTCPCSPPLLPQVLAAVVTHVPFLTVRVLVRTVFARCGAGVRHQFLGAGHQQEGTEGHKGECTEVLASVGVGCW
jgi:hypothetical protein